MICTYMVKTKRKSKASKSQRSGSVSPVRIPTRRDVVVNLLLSPPELEQIDNFRAKHRFSSRNEAMRRLMAFALKESANIPALPL
jgi:hypothetical protein